MEVKYAEIRQAIIAAGVKMLSCNLVVGTWGNISARIPNENLFAITPSGVDYDTIDPTGIVIMDFQGKIVDGLLKPSIEYNLHAAIYRDRSDVNAIVHTHSEYCTALAIARKGIPGAAEDLVQIVGGDVRVSKYKLPGSEELGVEVVKALKDRNAVILANHGCLGAAKSLNEAMKVVAVVEKSAKATIFAQVMGGVVELSQADIDFMRNFYLNQYGQR